MLNALSRPPQAKTHGALPLPSPDAPRNSRVRTVRPRGALGGAGAGAEAPGGAPRRHRAAPGLTHVGEAGAGVSRCRPPPGARSARSSRGRAGEDAVSPAPEQTVPWPAARGEGPVPEAVPGPDGSGGTNGLAPLLPPPGRPPGARGWVREGFVPQPDAAARPKAWRGIGRRGFPSEGLKGGGQGVESPSRRRRPCPTPACPRPVAPRRSDVGRSGIGDDDGAPAVRRKCGVSCLQQGLVLSAVLIGFCSG